jgi:hypothetical protein
MMNLRLRRFELIGRKISFWLSTMRKGSLSLKTLREAFAMSRARIG